MVKLGWTETDAKSHIRKRDLLIAPACEAALILVMAVAAWLSQQPLIFASLGPTAFEQIETPTRPSARPYNIIVGHLIAVLAGFAALYITHAWMEPGVARGHVTLPRVEAAVLSAALTVLGTLLARAAQPAALATTLLVSLGMMQTWQDGLYIMLGALLITAVGEPLRRLRCREHGGLDPTRGCSPTKTP